MCIRDSPNALRSIFVPFLSALIVIPLLIVVIGPIGVWGGELFANLFRSTYELSPVLAGAIIGGIWQILIIFGMHIAILGLVSAPNIAMYGRAVSYTHLDVYKRQFDNRLPSTRIKELMISSFQLFNIL